MRRQNVNHHSLISEILLTCLQASIIAQVAKKEKNNLFIKQKRFKLLTQTQTPWSMVLLARGPWWKKILQASMTINRDFLISHQCQGFDFRKKIKKRSRSTLPASLSCTVGCLTTCNTVWWGNPSFSSSLTTNYKQNDNYATKHKYI